MKVAVSVDESGMISSHLGKSKIFLIFNAGDSGVDFVDKRFTEGNHENHIIEDIKDCTHVISAKIGEGMVESLAGTGIKAIVETEVSNPRRAVKRLII